MHDNPQDALGASVARTFDGDHALPCHSIIELTGRDAVAFAHAQTMNDVAAMPDGHWHWNGWLTPKGRVVALFALLRFSPECVWLVLADADPTALVASLERFVFRSKVRIGVRGDLQVRGAFAQPATARGAALAQSGGVVELDAGGDGGARCLRIVPIEMAVAVDATTVDTPTPVSHATVDTSEFERAWDAFDLVHGWPRLPADQWSAWTPQQLSLDRLSAYSVRKGCYPGQEIVARTHFLGKAKRGLTLIEGARGLRAGMALHAIGSDNALGTLVCGVEVSSDQSVALAVVPLQRDAGGLHVEGSAVHEIALRDGLTR